MKAIEFIKKFKDELNNDIVEFFNLSLDHLSIDELEELILIFKTTSLPGTTIISTSEFGKIDWCEKVFADMPSYDLFDNMKGKEPWRFKVQEWYEKFESSPIVFKEKVDTTKLINSIVTGDTNFVFMGGQNLQNAPKYAREVSIYPMIRIVHQQIIPIILIRLSNKQEEPGKLFYLTYNGIEDIEDQIGKALFKIMPGLGIGYDEKEINSLIIGIKTYIIDSAIK